MKEYKSDNRKSWIIISTIVGIIAIGTALFFYHSFFRQNNAKLIETIPSEAAFIFEINDNEEFTKTSSSLIPYLNPVFSLEALSGFEFFIDKFSHHNEESIVISGHNNGDKTVLLLSTKIDERTFKTLLKTLKIDPRNHLSFEETKIYSYGTHYKNFKFVFHNNIFSISEDVELLKKSIVQLKHPKNLLSNQSFNNIFKLVQKNEKQNWLMIHFPTFCKFLNNNVVKEYQTIFLQLQDLTEWGAYHIQFKDLELSLVGYSLAQSDFFQKFDGQMANNNFKDQLLPFNTDYYIQIKTPGYKAFAQYFSTHEKSAKLTEIESFLKISPVNSFYFDLKGDSCYYHYLALQPDSNHFSFSNLFAEDINIDSLISANPSKIYPTDLSAFNGMFSLLHKNASFKYVFENQGYYIFSDTIPALQHYMKAISKNNYLEQNALYKFSKSNMPSESLFELACFNQNGYLNSFMSKESKLQNIRVFTISFDTPINDYIATNIYLKF